MQQKLIIFSLSPLLKLSAGIKLELSRKLHHSPPLFAQLYHRKEKPTIRKEKPTVRKVNHVFNLQKHTLKHAL
ncbi:MAG: hypothetical protein AB8G22_15950 [Saprospiraceae bacterium]